MALLLFSTQIAAIYCWGIGKMNDFFKYPNLESWIYDFSDALEFIKL
jgi:hypothetical protein